MRLLPSPSGKYKMVRINYANPDMVGHTGDLAATIKSCEVVDSCVKELLEVADSVNARCDDVRLSVMG